MKKVVLLAAAAFVIFLIVNGIQSSIERAQTVVKSIEDVQAQEGIPVVVTDVVTRDLIEFRSFTGQVKGLEQADATAMILEKIEGINVTVGSRVNRDQVLVNLDRTNPAARYRQASDAFAEAVKDRERSSDLLEAGAISEQMYDRAVLAENIARADLDAVNRMLEVRAPISGLVTDIFYDEGETVNPGAPIIRVAKLETVITEIEVGDSEIPLFSEGLSARIQTRTFPDRVFEGRVSRIALSTNPSARNFTIKIEIPNLEHLLKPGMFTTVDVVISEATNRVAVPADALVSENGSTFVYIINGETARKVPVVQGITSGTWVEVSGEISESDIVVIEGHNKLQNGSKVVVIS